MAFLQLFPNARPSVPDLATLQTNLRATLNDATITVYPPVGDGFVVTKEGAAWSVGDIAACQGAIDAAPSATPQSLAQAEIDRIPLTLEAVALLLVDKLNDINGNLVVLLAAVNALNTKVALPATTLPNPTPQAITKAQAISAIRAKAGTL